MYIKIKRGIDLILALGLLIIFGIPMCIIAICIKLEDGGQVIYKSKRMGKGLKEFNVYKFRSMTTKREELHSDLSHEQMVTKVGKVIRKTSLDELPQLLNILKGDMSVIGNRPYLPREKKDMNGYFDEIVKTKPGLTGYWQGSGRSKTDFKTRLKLESYYSNHMSLKMDIKIFFGTFSAVFGHVGAK